MTISIIGCGWLGFPLAKHLTTKGHTIKGSTTRTEKLKDLETSNIQPFLIKAVPKLLGEHQDVFFDTDLLFINIPPRRKNPNIEITYPQAIQELANKIIAHQIPKVIFVSSTSVYENTNTTISERTTPNPLTASGKAVYQAEQILQNIPNIELTILRMAGLVGGERKAGRFLAGRKNVANGDAPVNLVRREDCMSIIDKIIKQEKFEGIYNVCANQHPTRAVFYQQQAQKQGFEPPQFSENATTSYKIVDNQKIKTALDYEFLHPDPMLF